MWQRNGAAALVLAVAGIGCCSSLGLAHGGGSAQDPRGDTPEALRDVWLVRYGHLDHMVWNLFFVVPEGEDKGRVRTAEEGVHVKLLLDVGSRRAGAEYVAVVSGHEVQVKRLPGRQTVGKGRVWKNVLQLVGFKFPTRLSGHSSEFEWRLKIQSADGKTLEKIPEQGWAKHPQTFRAPATASQPRLAASGALSDYS